MTTDFSSLPLSPSMLHNLGELGYHSMTPVQAESLPHVLAGKDVIARAKTGSGKTAAFGIGLLHKLKVKKFRVQTLVLCPTRELADQVAKELRRLARATHNVKILSLCGGVAFGPQYGSLLHGAHIIVGTPGRVLRHLDAGNLSLKDMDTLVLDEADRMLDMGFIDELDDILAYAPAERQTLLFSATYPDAIMELSASLQNDAILLETVSTEPENKITEIFYNIEDKQAALETCLGHYKPSRALVFCNTKQDARDLADDLYDAGVDALAIHGDLEQYERVDVLVRFMNRSCTVLVATDVAARGIDIKDLDMVVNYEPAQNEATYTHRIGRTGRAGEKGLAISLFNEDEAYVMGHYENESRSVLDIEELVVEDGFCLEAPNATIVIEGGKKQKVRAGDILGSLTRDAGFDGKMIGKIDIYDRQSYVAIDKSVADEVYRFLKRGRIKGRSFPVWRFK